jgi:HD-like signal output (HDOD) protein
MKVILEFEDQDEAMTALNAGYWKLVVWNLDQSLRHTIKHSDKEEPEYEKVRHVLHEFLNDYNLILE